MLSILSAFHKNKPQAPQTFLKKCGDSYSMHHNPLMTETSTMGNTSQIEPTTLVRLVYISQLCWRAKFDNNIFNDIEQDSSKYNLNNKLTGILCYGNDYFYQCVEGEYRYITLLRDRLCKDKRHKNLYIYTLEPIKRRRYTGWSMKPVVVESWQLDKAQRKYLRPIRNYLPFKPMLWTQSQWEEFNENIVHFDRMTNASVLPKNSTSSITHSVIKKIAPHQAFLLVQAVLLVLIAISVSAFIFL